jgi:hypothetical protein
MDPLFSLLIALVIAFPVLAIIALVLAIGARERVRKLELRLAGLEGQLSGLALQPAPPPSRSYRPRSRNRRHLPHRRDLPS